MTQSNFFDAIGVADMEKVHSAVIGWMLSDKCEAFDIATRSKLLQQIFGIEGDHEVFDSIESHIEWKNIDILIVTTKGYQQKCWVIENKIKSSQHSDQLNRYVDTINDEEQFRLNEKAFCFLTLIEESPRCSKPVTWVNTKYEDLFNYIKNEKLNSNKDGIILGEYLDCIQALKNAFNDFKDNHVNYENVFNDGELKKVDKLKKWNNPATIPPKGYYFRYISDNGLETIFQKCFLAIIIPQTRFRDLDYSISETRGTALVDFHYGTTKDKRVRLGFQFQNGSFKVQILEEGTSGNDFYGKWFDIIKGILPNLNGNGNWTVNPSKKKAKPYLSISTNRDPEWYKGEIIDKWNNAFENCSQALEVIKTEYDEGLLLKQ